MYSTVDQPLRLPIMAQPQLTEAQIRRLFRRNYGAANQLAEEIGERRWRISLAIRGLGYRDHALIQSAIRRKAQELLAKERRVA